MYRSSGCRFVGVRVVQVFKWDAPTDRESAESKKEIERRQNADIEPICHTTLLTFITLKLIWCCAWPTTTYSACNPRAERGLSSRPSKQNQVGSTDADIYPVDPSLFAEETNQPVPPIKWERRFFSSSFPFLPSCYWLLSSFLSNLHTILHWAKCSSGHYYHYHRRRMGGHKHIWYLPFNELYFTGLRRITFFLF